MNKYEYVANDLINRIKNKEFTHKLPTEEQLMETYNVSRNTIRNAIKTLVRKDIIYIIQGSGIFIRPKKNPQAISLSTTSGITADNPKESIHTKVLKLEILEADKQLAQRFHCEEGTPIYYIERLRMKNNVPYAIEYTYYNKSIIPYIGEEIASQSIFNYIRNDLKISFGFADKYLEVVKLDQKNAELLQLNENDPALKINDHVYTNTGQMFNASYIYYSYTQSQFYISNTYSV